MKEACMKERRGRAGRESKITGGINENRTQNDIIKTLLRLAIITLSSPTLASKSWELPIFSSFFSIIS
jgi:hypothetical protein